MASILASHPNDLKQILPISPVSSGAMGNAQNPSPIDASNPSGRGRQRSRSLENEGAEQDVKAEGHHDGQNGASSNSDGPGPARKRRRSRKGLDKRFECSAEGCGKSYSRAEHLYVLSQCNTWTCMLTNDTQVPSPAKSQLEADLPLQLP